MSRMGDTIRAQRVKYGMTEKQLARKTGCAESFIKDVESGRRIPSDDVARRLLKAMGVTDALGTELDAAAEPEVQLRPKPRPYIIPVPENEPAPTQKQQEAQQAANDAWLDALGGVVKRVPVCDDQGVVIDHVLTPIVGGKIEGGAPDKVLYYRCGDNSLRGFRIYAGDLLLTIPAGKPEDDQLMLVLYKGKRIVRKLLKLDGSRIQMQSFDFEFATQIAPYAEVQVLGKCVKLQRTL